jgi:peptidoglycan hydrolase CwlO-like protein
MNKKLTAVSLLFLAFTQLLFPVLVSADSLQDQLNSLNSQIKQIQNDKNNLQGQINSNNYTINLYSSELNKLYTEKQLYDKQIQEIELQIKELELQIQQVNLDIDDTKSDISKTEGTVVGLEKQSEDRIKDSYYNFRMYGGETDASSIFNVSNINTYFKDSQYKEIIQSDTNHVMIELAELKQELQDKKTQLDAQLIQVKKDKEVVDIKRTDLGKKKEEADLKYIAYQQGVNALQSKNQNTQNLIQAYSQDEIYKKAEANKIQQQIFNSFSSIPSGQFVVRGTRVGNQGCTGLCTGPHVHLMVTVNGGLQNPCAHLKGGVCGYGSKLDYPLQPVVYFTSGYGNRCYLYNGRQTCDFHNGIDIVGSYANAPVYAPMDGYVFKGTDGYGAKYVIICENRNCNIGYKIGLWHLSAF